MSRMFGTVVRGVRAPIFREGDDVVKGTVETVLNALKEGNVQPRDRDIVAITESVVARTQGNYATIEQIAADAAAKTGGKTVGVTFPILSRNRFSVLLSGIAAGCQKVVLMLSYPSDEVGNHLISMDRLDEKGIDPWRDVLSLPRRVRLGHPPLYRRGLCGILFQPYPGSRRRGGGGFFQPCADHPGLHRYRHHL